MQFERGKRVLLSVHHYVLRHSQVLGNVSSWGDPVRLTGLGKVLWETGYIQLPSLLWYALWNPVGVRPLTAVIALLQTPGIISGFSK